MNRHSLNHRVLAALAVTAALPIAILAGTTQHQAAPAGRTPAALLLDANSGTIMLPTITVRPTYTPPPFTMTITTPPPIVPPVTITSPPITLPPITFPPGLGLITFPPVTLPPVTIPPVTIGGPTG